MQSNKGNRNIVQIEKIAINSVQITQSISDVIGKFCLKSLFKDTAIVKCSGVLSSTIKMELLIFPFYGAARYCPCSKADKTRQKQGRRMLIMI